MKDQLEQIRKLLSDIEEQATAASVDSGRDFSALELPIVIQEIVDDLQPLLTPYDAAFYWFMFRHSVAKNGSAHIRVSTRNFRTAVVKSSSNSTISLHKVRGTLRALESIGAIRKEGEPNRDGTPYRVLIPDEIDACRKFRAERQSVESAAEVKPNEIDHYNVKENRIKVYERDEYKCRYCGKQLTRFTCTLDHVKPVTEGGDNSFENLITACLGCNSRKNGRSVGDFLAEQ